MTPAPVPRGQALWALALLLGLGLADLCAAEPLPAATVDLQEAFQHSPLVFVLSAQLDEQFRARRGALRGQLRALGELRNRLQGADAEARPKLEEQVLQKSQALAKAQETYRKDLETAQSKKTQELLAKVQEVAAEVARDKRLTLLVNRGAVLYSGEGVPAPLPDITEDVIRALLQKTRPSASDPAPPGSR